MTSDRNGRTALYRLFDQEGGLLYIGISHKPDVRWGQHSEDKEWWPSVDRRAVEWHDTRVDAERAESAAIKAERPMHNVIHVPKPRRPQNTNRHTKPKPIRVPDPLWHAYGRVTNRLNTDRTNDLLDHMRTKIKEHGSEQDLADLADAEQELAERRSRKGGRPRTAAKGA